MNNGQDLSTFLAGRMEPTEPADTIIRTLRERFDGKPFTERTVKALREATGDDSIELRKGYGMAHLEWGGYSRNRGNSGGSMLIDWSEKNLTVDAAGLVERNPGYFRARDERNAGRRAALADPAAVAALDAAISDYHATRAAFDAARGRLEALTGYGNPFEADDHAIRRELLGEKG